MDATSIIIVTGSVTARPDSFDALLAASIAHVARSRSEVGCLSHEVGRSAEAPLQLLFVERWTDREALARHFAQPGSRSFVASVRQLAAGMSGMEIYRAVRVD